MNLNFWKNKNILITGHTGFKGAWLSILLNYLGANVYGVSDVKKEGIYKVVEKSSPLRNSKCLRGLILSAATFFIFGFNIVAILYFNTYVFRFSKKL